MIPSPMYLNDLTSEPTDERQMKILQVNSLNEKLKIRKQKRRMN